MPDFNNVVDVDECKNKSNDCHAKATCKNVDGSYKCQCSKGYIGNGKQCRGKV